MWVCRGCGAQHSAFKGRCRSCGRYGVIVRAAPDRAATRKIESRLITSTMPGAGRLLGHGVPAGCTLLVAGEPGAGKSTWLAQWLGGIEDEACYVSAEETEGAVMARLDRVGVDRLPVVVSGRPVSLIKDAIARYRVTVVDSIQAFVAGARDPVGAIRRLAQMIQDAALDSGHVVVIVGQLNAGESIAGPRMLEHLVDGVLRMHADGIYRVLVATKYRHGATDRPVCYRFGDRGLELVDRSAVCVASFSMAPGMCLGVGLDGHAPRVVDVQARSLGGDDPLIVSRSIPLVRIRYLCAVAGEVPVSLDSTLYESGMDAALITALHSARLGVGVPWCTWGEVLLSGAIRGDAQDRARQLEADRVGVDVRRFDHVDDIRGAIRSLAGKVGYV